MLKALHTPGLLEAGCDEAGRGCLAGPVVAAAVILDPTKPLESVNDSKQLSAKSREELRFVIQRDALAWAVCSVSNEEIDVINILNASLLAMHKSVESLPYQPEHLLIDGNRFKPFPFTAHTCIVKGDSKFRSIAAASILAKTYRDELMRFYDARHPQYLWSQNKGYPTRAHREAIQRYGVCELHRLSFKLRK